MSASSGNDVLSTEGLSTQRALDHWAGILERTMLRFDVDAWSGNEFSGRMAVACLGDAEAYEVNVAPQRMWRTRDAIQTDGHDHVILSCMREGWLHLRHSGSEDVVRQGDCVLLDSATPYEFTCPEPSRTVVLRFPRRWFDERVRSIDDLAGHRIDGSAGWGRAVSAFMSALEVPSGTWDVLPPACLTEQLTQLLTLALGLRRPAATRHQAALLRRARNVMRDRLGEEGLSPAEVARELRVSRSYLHDLFASDGTTFMRDLHNARLRTARSIIAGAAGDGLSVGDVAARCGFANPSHFARRFRAAYGIAPSRYKPRADTR